MTNYNSELYTIKTAKSVEEVEGLRGIWEQLHPNADIDFYLTIIKARREIVCPHVMVISFQEKPQAIMIGRIEERLLDFKIGYKTVFKPKARILTIIYSGLLGDFSHSIVKMYMNELSHLLRRGEIDAVLFSNLKVDSEMYRAVKSEPPFFCRNHISVTNVHWKLELPKTIDDFYKKMSSHRRHELRRYLRVLEKNYLGKVAINCITKIEECEQLCGAMEDVTKKSYHRGLGVGYLNNVENQRRVSLFAQRGLLRAYILYIENKPCAYWMGTVYGKTLYLDFTGYDPHYKKYEIGTILFVKMIEDLCQNATVTDIDFGFGDAFYKERFGDIKWEEATVYIYSPLFRGIKLKLMHDSTYLLSSSARNLLKWFNLTQKLKKKWRAFVQNKNNLTKDDNT